MLRTIALALYNYTARHVRNTNRGFGAVYVLAADDHVLVLWMHHIVSDGQSFMVFFKELAAVYGASSVGREAELAPLPVTYSDYAAWENERAAECFEEVLSIRLETLGEEDPLTLGTMLDRLHAAVLADRWDEVEPFGRSPTRARGGVLPLRLT